MLYLHPMTKRMLVGFDQTRRQLAQRIDAGLETGEHTIITRYGKPAAVLVPPDWYARASELTGDPFGLITAPEAPRKQAPEG